MNTDPNTLGLAYLATPYSRYKGGIAPAFADACKLAAKLMMCGVKVYSPIVHCHSIAMHGAINPLDHAIWLPFDQAMMVAADVLVVAHMDGWDESFGIGEEIKFFEAAGKPIFDLDPATLLMVRRKTSGMPRLEELRSILTRDKSKSSGPFDDAMAIVDERDKEIAAYKPEQGEVVIAGRRRQHNRVSLGEDLGLAHGKTRSEQGGSSA